MHDVLHMSPVSKTRNVHVLPTSKTALQAQLAVSCVLSCFNRMKLELPTIAPHSGIITTLRCKQHF